MGRMPRVVVPLAGSVLLVAVVVAALAGFGDPSAACLVGGCDCEAVRSGSIRQPANAWSSLSLVGVGLWILASSERRGLDALVGWAVLGSGMAAFGMHASLSSWSARLDGIAVASVVAAVAARAWSDHLPAWVSVPAAAVIVGAGALAGTPALNALTLAIGAVAAAGTARRIARASSRLFAIAISALVLGAAAWWLGRSGGPWCDPEVPILHAAWHLLAAAAIAAVAAILRSEPSAGSRASG